MASPRRPKYRAPIDQVGKHVTWMVGQFGRALQSPLKLPGLLLPGTKEKRDAPGAVPGIEHLAAKAAPPEPGAVPVTVVDYSPNRIDVHRNLEYHEAIALPRPDDAAVRWMNIDGLNPVVVNQVREHFNLHTLAAEDVASVPQRPKLEPYGEQLFIIARMLMLREGGLFTEQVSIFHLKDTIITFQEATGDVWGPVRDRLHTGGSRIRTQGADYLLYALMDALIDHCFPILEAYSEELEALEEPVMLDPEEWMLRRIHHIKRELAVLRRVLWPMRDVVDGLYRDEEERFSPANRTYLRDVHDHAVQVIEIIETHRELATGLSDLYMNAMSNRMNEVMKTLTIMATIFIPLSFIAGVFGMNFEAMPELGVPWMYPWGFWLVCLGAAGGLLLYFRRRHWI